jgi:hypothetical protein
MQSEGRDPGEQFVHEFNRYRCYALVGCDAGAVYRLISDVRLSLHRALLS